MTGKTMCLVVAASGILASGAVVADDTQQQVPQQQQALQQTEGAALAAIRAGGAAGRFVISAIRPSGALPVGSFTIVEGWIDEEGKTKDAAGKVEAGCRPATLWAEYPNDSIPMEMTAGGRDFPSVLFTVRHPNTFATVVCDEPQTDEPEEGPSVRTQSEGTVWRFRGRHSFKKVVFEGDSQAPLAFLFHTEGFVHLSGVGRVILPDGTVVSLPLEDAKR